MLQFLFWCMIGIVFYTYIGYGILVFLLVKIRGKKNEFLSSDLNELPTIIHLIAAYNEEDFINDKLDNSLRLTFPKDKYQVWVVTDGSTDKTPELVKSRKDVRLFHQDKRMGKIHAVNRVMKEVDSDIVVFSDANTEINTDALLKIVKHFQDEKVGVVAGEKRIHVNEKDEAASSGEGFYWKYESFLKRYDYYLYSTVGAAGELFSMRVKLFESVPEDTLIEDFYLSMKIASNGYRIAYEPEAFAVEYGSETIMEESKRKIRIAAGGLQATWRLRKLFNIFKYGWLSFQFISHRVFRWTIAPLALPVIFLTNGILASSDGQFYTYLFILQLFFYLMALMGAILQSIKVKLKVFFIPFYFVFMNWAVYLGFLRLITGSQSVVWARAGRKKSL